MFKDGLMGSFLSDDIWVPFFIAKDVYNLKPMAVIYFSIKKKRVDDFEPIQIKMKLKNLIEQMAIILPIIFLAFGFIMIFLSKKFQPMTEQRKVYAEGYRSDSYDDEFSMVSGSDNITGLGSNSNTLMAGIPPRHKTSIDNSLKPSEGYFRNSLGVTEPRMS